MRRLCWLDRNDDMDLLGGRHPCSASFDVTHDPSGRLARLAVTAELQVGHAANHRPAELPTCTGPGTRALLRNYTLH